ncbi:hypothetical protein BGZ80_000533 [Entomortierella chlamydospora]|uniref:Uncharacterized protein n=1 Tax=Entomortierella chlamydospora TaxID=101097 RepID=A0A9P6MS39_9FUNG|nr:hypothetical protein BGZ80_000533 [Entomortierella chlamydospora]
MSADLTAEELALEAMLESRLEIISAQAKAKRMYIIEDNLLRLQGKPGLSNQYLVNGSQPRKNLGIGNDELEEFKMGVKTLRRKFQAAGAVVSTVGWWRHLKEKEKAKAEGAATAKLEITATPSKELQDAVKTSGNIKKLSVDTALAMESTPTTTVTSPTQVKSPILSPKAMLSPTSSSTRRRATMDLQQIFSPPPVVKPVRHIERANPALGLISPPMSPEGPIQPSSVGSTLTRGLSLRS